MAQREEKEIHLRQRQVLEEQLKQMHQQIESLNNSISQLQSKVCAHDEDIRERNQHVIALKKTLDEVTTQFKAEQAKRVHFENEYEKFEMFYNSAHKENMELKRTYQEELMAVQRAALQIAREWKRQSPSKLVQHQAEIQAQELNRIQSIMIHLQEMQRRYLNGMAQLEGAIRQQDNEKGAQILSRTKEITELIAALNIK